jgi:hypothetical protein
MRARLSFAAANNLACFGCLLVGTSLIQRIRGPEVPILRKLMNYEAAVLTID